MANGDGTDGELTCEYHVGMKGPWFKLHLIVQQFACGLLPSADLTYINLVLYKKLMTKSSVLFS